jgi:hypothetical protein
VIARALVTFTLIVFGAALSAFPVLRVRQAGRFLRKVQTEVGTDLARSLRSRDTPMFVVFATVERLNFAEELHTLSIRRFPPLDAYRGLSTEVLRQYRQELEARSRLLQVAGGVAGALFGVIAAFGIPFLWTSALAQFGDATGDVTVVQHWLHGLLGGAALLAIPGLFALVPFVMAAKARHWIGRSEAHLSYISRQLSERQTRQNSPKLVAWVSKWVRRHYQHRRPHPTAERG